MKISRRGLIQGLTASALLSGAPLRAQGRAIATPIAMLRVRAAAG